MTNPDSFIEEVTEEIRRDRLYGILRRYGWIGIVAVLGIVGGTAYHEWSKSRHRAAAQLFGDNLLDALDTGSPEERQAAFEAITASGPQSVVRDLILSADRDADKATALAALDRVIAAKDATDAWRDLARMRRVALAGKDLPLAERRATLEDLARPGAPYRALAAERLAWLLVEEGRNEEAITALRRLAEEQDASPALKARANAVILALGGEAPPAAAGEEAENAAEALLPDEGADG